LEVINSTPENLSRLMAAFGTKDREFFEGLLKQLARVKSCAAEPVGETFSFLLSFVKNTQPRNELEAMLLAQMGACHKIAMDLTGRLNNPEEYRLFLKTMKTFADLKETFDRGRKASEHSFLVQNMTVKDGGQAIVGNVTQRSAEPLPRVDESPELAPCSPVAEQGEDSQAFGQKNDQ
jgi:hypothetical protein